MLDSQLRRVSGPPMAALGGLLGRAGIPATSITVVGWVVGVGACVAAGAGQWPLALALWLTNRALDGLDGAVARAVGASDRGGFLDIVADFSIYGGFVVGVAVAVPDARLACAVLLLTYYASGTTLLALSSILERRGAGRCDERSIRFAGGLAEGTETIVVYVLFCLLPDEAQVIAWAFAGAVALTAAYRIREGLKVLAPTPEGASLGTQPRSPLDATHDEGGVDATGRGEQRAGMAGEPAGPPTGKPASGTIQS